MAPRRSSKIAGTPQGETDSVDPSTLGSADGPLVPDGDDSTTPIVPCEAVGPVDAPVIQDDVDPVIRDSAAPMCDGDPDDIAPKIADASKIPVPVFPDPVISGDADP